MIINKPEALDYLINLVNASKSVNGSTKDEVKSIALRAYNVANPHTLDAKAQGEAPIKRLRYSKLIAQQLLSVDPKDLTRAQLDDINNVSGREVTNLAFAHADELVGMSKTEQARQLNEYASEYAHDCNTYDANTIRALAYYVSLDVNKARDAGQDPVAYAASLGITLSEKHSAWHRSYVSRKGNGYACYYEGKYGYGIALYTPSLESTTYSRVTYYTVSL